MIEIVLIVLIVLFFLSTYLYYCPGHFVKYFLFKLKYSKVSRKHLLKNSEYNYVLTFAVVIRFYYFTAILIALIPETRIVSILALTTFLTWFNLERRQFSKESTFKNLGVLSFLYFILSIILILA